MECIFVTGAGGQIGSELCIALSSHYQYRVIALDIKKPILISVEYVMADVTNAASLAEIFKTYRPTQVYHLAALLSATGEANPNLAWELNMTGLLNVLTLCAQHGVEKVFWPSSIAVFGPTSPRHNTPQYTIMDPSTVYGISKLAGERWCEYYFKRYELDVRSIRYPGIISWKTVPGGGTTDYAIHMYIQALHSGAYSCYLSAETTLPMLYMEDAIRATLELMHAPKETLTVHSSYNLTGMSFSPAEEALEIEKQVPDFKLSYEAGDLRQTIANSWPASIDDSWARTDWGWRPFFDLTSMTLNMMENLRIK